MITILTATFFLYAEPAAYQQQPQVANWEFPWAKDKKKKKKKKKEKEQQQEALAPLFPVQRDAFLDLTATVIVPCDASRFSKLRSLLQAYERQTNPPNEVIIALSQFETLQVLEVLELERFRWSFPVQIIKLGGKKSAGFLRNCAASQAKGDIILCQDPSALPHPRRVEVVVDLFESYYVDTLLHDGIAEEDPLLEYESPADLPLHRYRSYAEVKQAGFPVDMANICVAKGVAASVKWEEDQKADANTQFSEKTYEQFKNNLVVDVPLLNRL